MRINNCRNCNKKKLQPLFSLGKISFTGKFPKINKKIKKAPLEVVMCKHCNLVQLAHKFNLKYLYGPDYGYRSGISNTMVSHLKNVCNNLKRKTKLKKKEMVLDIASNDATLLKFYPSNVVTFGIDPLINKYQKEYKKINHKISDFFSISKIKKKTKNKFKIITALSVFYDLEKPNKFLKEVENLLDKNGIFALEFADLSSIIDKNMFDTICHEHLEYYSSKIIIDMCKKHNLKVIDILKNNINGSSKQFHIVKKNSYFKVKSRKIKKILNYEKNTKINSSKTLIKFFKKINETKINLIKLLKLIKSKNKSIHAYGASTKGNVLLQYFGIEKFGLCTPGTNIKIISEKQSRNMKPDYYLVLPWHFKNEILKRERKIIVKGTRFIFPLPKLKIF